jgi:putative flippase GtrA
LISTLKTLTREKRQDIVRFLKFCLVGAIGTGVDFGLFNLFHNVLGIHAVISNTLSVSAAIVNNYTWSRFWG